MTETEYVEECEYCETDLKECESLNECSGGQLRRYYQSLFQEDE